MTNPRQIINIRTYWKLPPPEPSEGKEKGEGAHHTLKVGSAARRLFTRIEVGIYNARLFAHAGAIGNAAAAGGGNGSVLAFLLVDGQFPRTQLCASTRHKLGGEAG